MNFGEVLLEEKANRKPNSGENLYLAALQLDQGMNLRIVAAAERRMKMKNISLALSTKIFIK